MAKHPGDSGDWNLAPKPRPSIREREATAISLVSPEVRKAMQDEDRFIAQIMKPITPKRFTDRRPFPGRTRERP